TKTINSKKCKYDPALTRDFEIGIVGELYSSKELHEPEDVLLDGKYAYVPCRGSNNLAVIDISNPRKPVLVSSFRDQELVDAMGVAKHGKYIYITSLSNFKCIVADASNPKELKKIYSFTVDEDADRPGKGN